MADSDEEKFAAKAKPETKADKAAADEDEDLDDDWENADLDEMAKKVEEK